MSRVQHKSFNPRHFTSNSENSLIEDSNFDEKIYTKGDKGNNYVVDLAGIESDVETLLKNPDVKISELDGNNKEKFNKIRITAQMLYDSEWYKCFFDRIYKHCVLVKNPLPGTVGGYICGCLASKNFVESSCTPICADGLAFPKDTEGWKHCNKVVIWATYNKDACEYTFNVVREPKNPSEYDPTYIFVDAEDIHAFKGFNVTEKSYLENRGITNVKIFGVKTSDNATTYPQLYSDIININDIKMRNCKNNNNDNGSYATIGLIIFIILLFIFICWLCRR